MISPAIFLLVAMLLLEECGLAQQITTQPLAWTVKSIKKIGEGSYPKWSKTKKLIAFNKVVNDKFEIFTMKPDGSDEKCLTSNKPIFSNGNRGQPYWHPNGEYIVFTAENINHKRTAMGLGLAEMPGIGRNHNVCIMKSDGSKFWQITDYPENWGAFRPSFSHNGKMLYWNEEYSMEKYPGIGSSWKWPGSFVPWIFTQSEAWIPQTK